MSYISNRHRSISESLGNPEILTDPEIFFEPNYKILLNAWFYRERVLTYIRGMSIRYVGIDLVGRYIRNRELLLAEICWKILGVHTGKMSLSVPTKYLILVANFIVCRC